VTARHTAMSNATSSRARSVEAYYPFYPPPVYPEGLEHTGYAGFSNNPPASSSPIDRAPVVRRNNLRWGERIRYTHGNVVKKWFRMLATGQVESTGYQPATNMPASAFFNDFLYRAGGYPRNLGLSEKVPTLPRAALGDSPAQMTPAPRITRTVFTRRNYTSAPAIAAKPSAS
jgi:hypothetical protein